VSCGLLLSRKCVFSGDAASLDGAVRALCGVVEELNVLLEDGARVRGGGGSGAGRGLSGGVGRREEEEWRWEVLMELGMLLLDVPGAVLSLELAARVAGCCTRNGRSASVGGGVVGGGSLEREGGEGVGVAGSVVAASVIEGVLEERGIVEAGSSTGSGDGNRLWCEAVLARAQLHGVTSLVPPSPVSEVHGFIVRLSEAVVALRGFFGESHPHAVEGAAWVAEERASFTPVLLASLEMLEGEVDVLRRHLEVLPDGGMSAHRVNAALGSVCDGTCVALEEVSGVRKASGWRLLASFLSPTSSVEQRVVCAGVMKVCACDVGSRKALPVAVPGIWDGLGWMLGSERSVGERKAAADALRNLTLTPRTRRLSLLLFLGSGMVWGGCWVPREVLGSGRRLLVCWGTCVWTMGTRRLSLLLFLGSGMVWGGCWVPREVLGSGRLLLML
jgi:hypothetical protein